jgi:hypothetical protein
MKTSLVACPLRWLLVLGLASLVSARAADVDSLVRALRDPDRTAEAKGDTCLQLMDLGPAAAPAVPALIGLLNNQDEMLRDYAVTTLDRIGPAARNALPALRRTAVKDSSAEIRELARSAITKIGGHAPSSEPASMPPVVATETEPAKSPEPAKTEPVVASPEPPAPQPEPPAPQQEVQAPKAEASTAESEVPHIKPSETERRPAPTMAARPALEVHPGRYFRWATPAGWKGSESANGVTLTSPDGLMQVSSALLLDQPGKMTPANFAVWMLDQLGYQSRQTIAKHDLPDQASGLGSQWKVQELEMRYTINGVPVRGVWTAAILTMDRTYDAYLVGYQSIPSTFEHAKLWLSSVAHSVTLTVSVGGAGNDNILSGSGNMNYVIKVQGAEGDKLVLPNNLPLDHPALLGIWREKGHSEDRILKAQRNGMMGYEQVKDPQTSRIFEVPLEAWDGAASGYHDPLRPEEVLQPVEQGD